MLGTATACNSPAISNRTSRSASRRSVLTRSAGPRGINPGAHTTQLTPAPSNRRASANPVGPASYVTRTGPGSPATNSTTSAARPDKRRRRSSPDSRSILAATVPLTCTSSATNVLACAMVGTPMIAVRAQATPEPQTRASHARVPTLTPRPDRPAAQDDRPYGLVAAAAERVGERPAAGRDEPPRVGAVVAESEPQRTPGRVVGGLQVGGAGRERVQPDSPGADHEGPQPCAGRGDAVRVLLREALIVMVAGLYDDVGAGRVERVDPRLDPGVRGVRRGVGGEVRV